MGSNANGITRQIPSGPEGVKLLCLAVMHAHWTGQLHGLWANLPNMEMLGKNRVVIALKKLQ